jgi:HEPN domain-containing protein
MMPIATSARARSRERGGREACHTRYFLQQAYEKAIKAYMLAKLGQEHANVELILHDTILGSHSPLFDFRPQEDLAELEERLIRQYPDHWQRGIMVLKTLRREAYNVLMCRRGANMLVQIDATRQSIRANVPSYRYPFFSNDETIVPLSWDGWDVYQGPLDDVIAAVRDLLDTVGLTVGTSGRRRKR